MSKYERWCWCSEKMLAFVLIQSETRRQFVMNVENASLFNSKERALLWRDKMPPTFKLAKITVEIDE